MERSATPGRRRGARRCRWALATGLLTALLSPASIQAQDDEPSTYAGSLWSRPRLSGDWLGLRDQMAARGVTVDLDLLQIMQGVGTGGRGTGVEYGGSAHYALNVDTAKLGLWPGGALNVYAMTGYGNNVDRMAGGIVPVNYNGVLPEPNESVTALMNLTYTQMFSSWFGVYLGKIDTVDGDSNEFADNYKTKFMNEGLACDFVNAMVPVSAWGGGVILQPSDGALFSAGVLDPNGSPTDNSLDHAFANGVMVTGQGRVTVKPFGLVGHQFLTFTWSDMERLSLQQDPGNLARLLADFRFPRLENPGPVLLRILERFFPELLVPAKPLNEKPNTWAVLYNFDQYLWSPQGDPNRGIGIFFRFGVTDGNPNPFKYGYSAGIGGKGVVPGRREDTFGIGWFRVDFSSELVPFLRQALKLGLGHEDVVELYY
ncbi:MAG TPA: carbohydrate porin, partial [Candidatus Methylomirabilis sp.]|nr:carbohydrate porin [Candidatus Methylomirabilis sp.]